MQFSVRCWWAWGCVSRSSTADASCAGRDHNDAVRITALDHVQLSLPQGGEQQADGFYVSLLGFEVEQKPPVLDARGGRWYRSGPVRFHLGVEGDFRPARRSHPAFTVDDLDMLVRTLNGSGIDVEWDENIPGVRRCYVADPFGNRLELIAAS